MMCVHPGFLQVRTYSHTTSPEPQSHMVLRWDTWVCTVNVEMKCRHYAAQAAGSQKQQRTQAPQSIRPVTRLAPQVQLSIRRDVMQKRQHTEPQQPVGNTGTSCTSPVLTCRVWTAPALVPCKTRGILSMWGGALGAEGACEKASNFWWVFRSISRIIIQEWDY